MSNKSIFFIGVFGVSLFANGVLCQSSIQFTDLVMGDSLKTTGRLLQNHSYGLYAIEYPQAKIDTIFVAVHGYESEGYEWVYALRKMASSGNQTYYFRNNWNQCPSIITSELKSHLQQLILDNTNIKHIIIFGHSYGGVIVGGLIDDDFPISLEIHSLAAPLAGINRTTMYCPNFPKFQEMKMVNSFNEWRTVHKQDGAFKNIIQDPQIVEINNSNIVKLPPYFKNGRRLGHNWSITWVIDKYFKKDK